MRALTALLCTMVAAMPACGGDEPAGPCSGDGCSSTSATGGAESCPAGTRADVTGACSEVGWHACGTRFVRDASGWECAPPAPGDTCDGAPCAPLGWRECPAGFALDAISDACRAVLPAAACPDGTRAALGDTACVPLGDCTAPFPPASATHFVDDDYGPGDIDATHFASIAAAVAAAPAGATIAIETGTYPEPLLLEAPVTLHGRCAAQVVLDGAGSDAAGLDVRAEVAASGITVRGFSPGVWTQLGGDLELEASALTANARAGILVSDPGSSAGLSSCALTANGPSGATFGQGAAVGFGGALSLEDCALDGNREHGVLVTGDDSSAALVRTVVQRTQPRASTGALGLGIAVQDGASATLEGSAVLDNRVAGVTVLGSTSALHVVQTEVARTAIGEEDGSPVGVGINAQQGATLTVQEATIADNGQDGLRAWSGAGLVADRVAALDNGTAGVWIEDAGTAVTLTASVVRGTVPARLADTLASSGFLVGNGATLDAADIVAEGNAGSGMILFGAGTLVRARRWLARRNLPLADGDYGFGITVEFGGTLELTDSAAVGNTAVGLQVTESGSAATLDGVTLRASVPNAEGRRGRGINVQNVATLGGTRVAIVDDQQTGLFAFGIGTAAALQDSLILGTRMDSAGFGHAAMAVAGARLDMTRVTLQGSAGIGMAVAGAAGSLAGSVVLGNAVGVHAQDGSALNELDALPPSLPSFQLAITRDVTFEGNASRIGSGQVPVPEAVGAPVAP